MCGVCVCIRLCDDLCVCCVRYVYVFHAGVICVQCHVGSCVSVTCVCGVMWGVLCGVPLRVVFCVCYVVLRWCVCEYVCIWLFVLSYCVCV